MIYVNEIDPYCAQWLQNLMDAGVLPAGHIDTRSIEDVTPNDLAGYTQCHFFAGLGGWIYALHLAGWPRDRPVWTGSCPCQPFSAAGKGDGFADERHLWPAWQHLIAQCAPPVVFGEQVEGPAARRWLDLVCSDLEGLGYAFGAAVIPAASVGSPQLRHRTWFVADAHDTRRQGAERPRQPGATGERWAAARGELVRSDRGSWPPGPGAVHLIPVRTDGVSNAVGGCKAYGNAIVPQVAAEFVAAFMNADVRQELAAA